MKVAISIPDATYAKAEALARRLNVSRSAVFAMAVDRLAPPEAEPTLTDLINAAIEGMDESDWEEQRMIMRAGARTVLKHSEW